MNPGENQGGDAPHKHKPYVPESMAMQEFTVRALVLGIAMTLILGAANAYLGLRAGVTIAATYPAAVLSMAILRRFKGTILEENIARTAGSIGESVAACAIFTLPAFVLAGAWPSFGFKDAYWKSTALMVVGSFLGVLFVSLVRRVMVEDRELPFPESVAAAEIHKAGQRGGGAVKHLFFNMALGAVAFFAGAIGLFAQTKEIFVSVGTLGKSLVRLGPAGSPRTVAVGGVTQFSAPSISPAYVGVGYIIGPTLAALNFSGGVLAWGLLVPLLIYFMGSDLQTLFEIKGGAEAWGGASVAVWRFIVRPIAVGGMLVGAAYTLYRMRKNLFGGLSRAVAEIRAGEGKAVVVGRTERYMKSRTVFAMIGVVFLLMVGLYIYLSGLVVGGIVAAVVMLIAGFFFATVSGYLVGMIGSSNNPISGLTLSTLIIAALLMLSLGVSGPQGVIAVLGVAAVVCVSSAVAGELLQDFKVGWLLGGTPRTIQLVELVSVTCASLLMYFPVMILHFGNIKQGGIGFGDPRLSAPQAGLMASLAQGIVRGEMAWPLVGVGVLMGVVMIMLQVRSPMLVAVGMYLPLDTTFAIFAGGMIRWATDSLATRRGYNEAQRIRVENVGILAASGLIAGEALVGLVIAGYAFFKKEEDVPSATVMPQVFEHPLYTVGLLVLALMAFSLIWVPLRNAGRADEPAPPQAMV